MIRLVGLHNLWTTTCVDCDGRGYLPVCEVDADDTLETQRCDSCCGYYNGTDKDCTGCKDDCEAVEAYKLELNNKEIHYKSELNKYGGTYIEPVGYEIVYGYNLGEKDASNRCYLQAI